MESTSVGLVNDNIKHGQYNCRVSEWQHKHGQYNEQSREIDNIGYTRWRKTKQKHNTIYVWLQYAQTNTNNVNKTWALLQTTGGKDEPNKHK